VNVGNIQIRLISEGMEDSYCGGDMQKDWSEVGGDGRRGRGRRGRGRRQIT
jgi:hypothetical protein